MVSKAVQIICRKKVLLIKKACLRYVLKIIFLRNLVVRKMLDNFAKFLKLCY